MIASWRPPAWFGRAYVVLVLAAFTWLMVRSRAEIITLWSPALVVPALGFVLGWMAMAATLGLLWSVHLRVRFGVTIAPSELLRIQALAWGGRYLPGKVGLLLGKMVVLRDGRLQARQLGQSVLVEQVAFVFAGALVAALLLVLPPDWLARDRFRLVAEHWLLLRAVVASAAVAGFLMVAWVSERTLLAQRKVSLRRLFGYLGLLGLHAGPHLLAGLGLAWLLWAAGLAEAGHWPQVVAALCMANIAGVLALFAPAGLGVREAVLAGSLAPQLPLAAAVAVAALLRVLSLLADLLLVSLGLLFGRRLAVADGGDADRR